MKILILVGHFAALFMPSSVVRADTHLRPVNRPCCLLRWVALFVAAHCTVTVGQMARLEASQGRRRDQKSPSRPGHRWPMGQIHGTWPIIFHAQFSALVGAHWLPLRSAPRHYCRGRMSPVNDRVAPIAPGYWRQDPLVLPHALQPSVMQPWPGTVIAGRGTLTGNDAWP